MSRTAKAARDTFSQSQNGGFPLKHFVTRLSAGLLASTVLMCGAQAATITTSTDQVTLDKEQTTFTVELRLQEDDPFSAAEFGIDLPSGMKLTGVEYLDEALRTTGQTPVVTRENRTYFGFYAGSNAFQGSYQVARLTFTYTGEEDTQFALGHSKIVTLTEDGSVGDTSSAPFTVSVIRSDDSSGGGSSGGGSGSGGGTDIGDGEVPLDPGVFVDLDGHWAKDSALRSVSLGLFSGTSATTFSPDMTMSRAMMAMVFYRMAGSPAVSGTDSFTDTAKDSWYSTAVTWAAQQGVISGYGDGRFGPDDPVTREQMVTILHSYAESCKYNVTAQKDLSAFTDAGQISSFAVESMRWAVAEGLVTGTSASTLSPLDAVSRGQAATILVQFYDSFVQ